MRLLEKEGLIVPSPEGAMTTGTYDDFLKELEVFLAALSQRADALRATLEGRQ